MSNNSCVIFLHVSFICLSVNYAEELRSSLGVLLKAPPHRTCRRTCPNLLYTPHDHAKVAALHHHSDTQWVHCLHNCISNLSRQPFLHLKAPRKHLSYSCQLRQPNNFTIRNVSNVHLSSERNHVMLAKRVNVDIPYHDHLLMGVFFKHSPVCYSWHILRITLSHEHQGLSPARGSL